MLMRTLLPYLLKIERRDLLSWNYIAQNNEKSCVARIAYWDAMGQFFLETFNNEIPLDIVEEFIAETKKTIKIR